MLLDNMWEPKQVATMRGTLREHAAALPRLPATNVSLIHRRYPWQFSTVGCDHGAASSWCWSRTRLCCVCMPAKGC